MNELLIIELGNCNSNLNYFTLADLDITNHRFSRSSHIKNKNSSPLQKYKKAIEQNGQKGTFYLEPKRLVKRDNWCGH